MFILAFLALVVSANAVCFSCGASRSLSSVVRRSSGTATQYALGTPDGNSLKQLTTAEGQVINSIELTNVKFLNKPVDGEQPLTAPRIRVLFAASWDNCGWSTNPYTAGKKQIFKLRADGVYDVTETPIFAEVPAPEAPEPVVEVATPELPEGPGCGLKNENHRGVCLDERQDKPNPCPLAPGSPYRAFAWSSGEVDDGCRPYNKYVKCCTLPRGFLASVPRPRARPSPAELAPEVVLEQLPTFTLYNCDDAVIDPCLTTRGQSGAGNCIDASASQALVANADALQLSNADIPGISTHMCATACQNGGTCVDNKCVCNYPFGGDRCENRLPTCSGAASEQPGTTCVSALTFENIIPGAGQGDTWMVGTTRPITFSVSGFDPAQTTKKVAVYIVNKDENPNCGGALTAVGNLFSSGRGGYYSEKVGEINLTGKPESFTAEVRVALTGSTCMTPGRNYAIWLESVDATGALSDGPALFGGPVNVAYTACFTRDQQIGNCMTRGACTGLGSDWTTAPGNACKGASVCCVPDHTPATTRRAWFEFQAPSQRNSAPVFAGATLPVAWDYNAQRTLSTLACQASGSTPFDLQLVRYGGRALFIGYRREVVVANFPAQTVGAKSATVQIQANVGGETLSPGQYFLRARVGANCVYSSREFEVKLPGCASTGSETILGNCIPATECLLDNNNPAYCGGAQGLSCCYATRTGMSAGFRDGDDARTLEIDANMVSLSLTALVAAFALQF